MTAPAIAAPAPKGRLGNGQVRRQVAEWLAARPGPHRVGEIAKDLGRSVGAVGNAPTTLADLGEAGRLVGKPVRYWANAKTAAATAAPGDEAPPTEAPRRRQHRRRAALRRACRRHGRCRPARPSPR